MRKYLKSFKMWALCILFISVYLLWTIKISFTQEEEKKEKEEVLFVDEGEEVLFVKEGIALKSEEKLEKDPEAPKEEASLSSQKSSDEISEAAAAEEKGEGVKLTTLEDRLEQKVDLSFTNANLTTVLSGISGLYGVNILIDKGITGTVTVNLKDVVLKDGISAILKANDYSYTIEDDMIKVVAYEEMGVTEVIQLNFVEPSVAYDFVVKFVSENGELKTNESLNCLIMTDHPKSIKKAKEVIEKIDLPPRQVLIEAKVLDITYTDLANLGVQWQSNIKTGSAIVQDVVDFDFSLPGPDSDMDSDQFTLGIDIKDWDIDATVEALIQKQKAKVLASPSIIALNNVEARINIGEKVPIREETQTTTGTTETTRFVDVGVTLRVTPRISGDDYVQLVIHPEVSSVSTILDAGPRITTREADTTVLVKNRQTVVIAGLLKEEEDHTKGKVPILGSVPILGWLFRNRSTETYQKELVIFITPYILPSPQEVMLTESTFEKKSLLEQMGDRMSFMELCHRAENLESEDSVESRNKDYRTRMHQAALTYEQLLGMYPDDYRAPEIQYHVGEIYYSKLENYPMAKKTFQNLLERYPGSSCERRAENFLRRIERIEKRSHRKRKGR